MKYFYFHFLTLNLKLKLKVEGGGSPSWRLIQSLMGNCLYGLWLALKTFIPEALTCSTVPFGKVKSDLLLIVPASSLNGFKKVSGPWFDCFSSVKSRNEMWLLVTMCKLVCGIVYKKPLDCISNCSGHSKTELQACKVIFGLPNDTSMFKNSVYACKRHSKLEKNSCACLRSE